MDAGSLDVLLSKLNEGDPAAAETVFLTYAPYLRMVVRRRLSPALRAKFDSEDIVQSVWACLLDGLRREKWAFHDSEQLRAFLIKMTRHRFIDRLRKNRNALARETPLSRDDIEALPAVRAARASEAVHVDELWLQMLSECPPAHYELLNLKRQGASLAEIAERTGLHESSVRRILYDIARRVGRRRATAGNGAPQ
ncbi:MAG TPA: sigma-70 family RNA polymerase sigma factor [Pirellulales bacterium]|jgi:RNA polymerase sigma-70 factor (ECF subfamily)|nr:sigma-70 family RNA polymerase sigma factor [Pirellulales bacterium]